MDIVGRRIVCVEMKDNDPVPSGTEGTVILVDGIGQIHVNWDNGRTLALVPEMDRYRLIEEDKRNCTDSTHSYYGCELFIKPENGKCQNCPMYR